MNNTILLYGKIIIDQIQLRSGELVPGKLGGGGPQAAFGMRLWHDDVALLSRSGTDIDPAHVQVLEDLGLDLSGWARYDDLPTPHSLLVYDADEQLQHQEAVTSQPNWKRLLSRPLSLSPQHQQAAGIHMITEFGNEPMADSARQLQRLGALFSLEPIFADHSCPDPAALLDLARQADIVTPDWPDASQMAGSQQLQDVLRYWSALGPQAVAIRHGANGSYVWDRQHGQAWHIPILPVQVVDPTGAGNAYGGGWCIGWWRFRDARLAGCYASVAAALMISHTGMPPLGDQQRQLAAELLDIALRQATPLEISD